MDGWMDGWGTSTTQASNLLISLKHLTVVAFEEAGSEHFSRLDYE